MRTAGLIMTWVCTGDIFATFMMQKETTDGKSFVYILDRTSE
jgi:hypothetical protein